MRVLPLNRTKCHTIFGQLHLGHTFTGLLPDQLWIQSVGMTVAFCNVAVWSCCRTVCPEQFLNGNLLEHFHNFIKQP